MRTSNFLVTFQFFLNVNTVFSKGGIKTIISSPSLEWGLRYSTSLLVKLLQSHVCPDLLDHSERLTGFRNLHS